MESNESLIFILISTTALGIAFGIGLAIGTHGVVNQALERGYMLRDASGDIVWRCDLVKDAEKIKQLLKEEK